MLLRVCYQLLYTYIYLYTPGSIPTKQLNQGVEFREPTRNLNLQIVSATLQYALQTLKNAKTLPHNTHIETYGPYRLYRPIDHLHSQNLILTIPIRKF